MTSIDNTALTGLLTDLVRVPSYPGIPRQEEGTVRVLSDFLLANGIEFSIKEVRDGRPNLIATLDSGCPGRHMILCGHTDTVPPNGGAQVDMFSARIEEGRMHGRGTVDMKGAVAAMAAALVALKSSSELRGKVTLAAVIDEEMESLGAEAFIESRFHADGAIVGEPTCNQIALGHKGLEWLEIEFKGKAAHGGAAHRGINAISAAARFVNLVETELAPLLASRRHPLLGSATINLGTIKGGDQPSTVAASCILQLDRRWLPSESVEDVFSEIESLLERVRDIMPGVLTSLRRVKGSMHTMVHAPLLLSEDHVLAQAALEARSLVLGSRGEIIAFPAWTDGSLLANFGNIPTLICGPGDLALAHTPWESIPLIDVQQAAEIYRQCAINFCSGV